MAAAPNPDYRDADGNFTWERIEGVISMPEKELYIEPNVVVFSSSSGYKKSQFARVSLRNNSKTMWTAFRLQQYQPREEHMQLSTDPAVGLVAPGGMAEFKLILSSRLLWPDSDTDMSAGRTIRLRIRQVCVKDPKGLFGDLQDEQLIRATVRNLFDAIGQRQYEEENACEKVYSRDIPVALPRVRDEGGRKKTKDE